MSDQRIKDSVTLNRPVEVDIRGPWQQLIQERDDAVRISNDALARLKLAEGRIETLNAALSENDSTTRAHLAALTQQSSSHLQTQQIMEQIRVERDALLRSSRDLSNRCSDLENGRDILERNNFSLQETLNALSLESKDKDITINEAVEAITLLNANLDKKDVEIAELKQTIADLSARLAVLTKAGHSKDSSIAAFHKEKHNLEEYIKRLESSMLPCHRKLALIKKEPEKPIIAKLSPRKSLSTQNPSNESPGDKENKIPFAARKFESLYAKLQEDLRQSQRELTSTRHQLRVAQQRTTSALFEGINPSSLGNDSNPW